MNLSTIKNKTYYLLLAAVIFYVTILITSDFSQILNELKEIRIELLVLTFPIMVLTFFITSWRFHLILHKLNIKCTFKESFLIFSSGMSMLFTPGAVGTIIRSHILKRKTGKSISSTSPIFIYEKWLELFSILIMIGFLLTSVDLFESKIILILGTIILILVFFMFRNSFGLKFFNKLLSKIRPNQNNSINTSDFQKTTLELLDGKFTVKMILLTIINKIIILINVFFIFQSLNVNLDIFTSGQIYFTSTLMGLLSFIPGGIIVTEASFLDLVMKNSVDFSIASVLVIITRFVTLWFSTLFGIIALKIISKN
jgi:glycosyltransferase 2 family protein